MKIVFLSLNLVFFCILAPFFSGLVAKVKNNLRMRKGQSLFQPYYYLRKLFGKEEVISQTVSWIFKIGPFAVFASALSASFLVPLLTSGFSAANFLALIFIFSFGRFFLALCALDSASSFGGMGASREMFISSMAEPALCMAIFSLFLQFSLGSLSNQTHPISVSAALSALSLFLVTIAETSRIPVDNQETHLELTMVHEAMVLEYSGRRLAMLELASYIKQMVLFSLIAQIIFPLNLPLAGFSFQFFYWIFWYIARLVIVALMISLVELSVSKMRLFRVADFLGFAFVIGFLSAACCLFGT